MKIFKKIGGLPRWFLKLSWKKKILTIVIVLFVGFIVFNIVRGKKPNYSFDTVTKDTITEEVTETGNVIVSGQYNVPSPATGILTEIFVKNGDQVVLGQKLFSVASTATPQEKATALANYLAAKSQLETANATLYSLQSVMYNNWKTFTDIAENSTYQNPDDSPNISNRTLTPFTIAQDNWLSAEANFKNQQNVISQSQAALSSATLAYQATQNATVTAPIAGIVYNLSGVVGSMVAPVSTTLNTGTPVLIISTKKSVTIKTVVNEVDINKIKVGNDASITFDAIKDKTFTGKVIQADDFGTNQAGIINYNVFVSVDDGVNLIKPNMTANLTIDTNKHVGVLTVINAAIRPYKGGKAVQVLDAKGKIQFKSVSVGLKGVDRIEVTKGVTAGEKVIIGNTTTKTPAAGGPFGG
jgi:multidrug efflux pump subunit AcrA (membrane-fusion protein)